MSDNEAEIIRIFGGDRRALEGEALKRWADRLRPHIDERKEIESVRHRRMPTPPWPAKENPMLGYLIDRACEVVAEDGLDAALIWVAAHAWFEGAVEERFRIQQVLLHDESG